MKLHRNLGLLGGLLSGLVVLFGCAIAVRQASQNRPFPFPDVHSMLAISFGQMLLFAVFISLGLRLRRDAKTHQRIVGCAIQSIGAPSHRFGFATLVIEAEI